MTGSTADGAEPTVEFSVADGLGVIRLNRPSARNAIDQALVDGLSEAVQCCAADAAVRAVLICANGPAFTVAGGGLGLIYVADIVIAAEGTRFTTGFSGLGLSGDGGGTWFLPRLVGMRRAAELYFGQRVLTAEEAQAWGLISCVVPAGDLAAEAEQAARELAAGPTRALGEIRALLRRSPDVSLGDQLHAETEALSRTAGTRDAAHAIESFIAKTRPGFGGW